MNPGLTEETAKVANNVVSGLSRSPLMLTMILFNGLVFGGFFYLLHEMAERNERKFTTIMKFCIEATRDKASQP